jgi:hypothetical protein
VREMIEAYGAFVEVHVATSLEECERRDRKGLYKLAREGKIKEFTGISDPYEAPNTEGMEVDYCAELESMVDASVRDRGDADTVSARLLRGRCQQVLVLKLESMGACWSEAMPEITSA